MYIYIYIYRERERERERCTVLPNLSEKVRGNGAISKLEISSRKPTCIKLNVCKKKKKKRKRKGAMRSEQTLLRL